ncbi:MAG: hypothetical protein COB98_02380 [Flavobacteriaceae bacterium]|nr:MAG: hypothetical protein COB98_02380 [Flavobacteriaceae bacterium]
MFKIVNCYFSKVAFFSALIFCIGMIFPGKIHAQEHSNFMHLSSVINNRQVRFQKIIQDELGYMWMINSEVVQKYDGYNYTTINLDAIFENPSVNDFVFDLVKDKMGNLWLISFNGLVAKYSADFGFTSPESLKNVKVQFMSFFENELYVASKTGEIYRCNLGDEKLERLTTISNVVPKKSEITGLVGLKDGQLFIATSFGTLYKYNLNSTYLQEIKGAFSGFPGNLNILADLNSNLWIGTEIYGLFVYDTIDEKFIQEKFFKKPYYNLDKELIITIFCDTKGIVWAGTDGGGLYKIDTQTGSVKLYIHNDTNRFSLGSNSILSISEDNQHNIWVLTNYGSINILPGGNDVIGYHAGTLNNIPARILSMYETRKGDLWVGTDGQGITHIQKLGDVTEEVRQYFKPKGFKKGLYVQSIIEDSKANIWFGTYKNGLWHYDVKHQVFERIIIKNHLGQPATDVRTVFTDSKNRIWVGSNIAINVYDVQKRLLATFRNNRQGIKGLITTSILEDKNSNIWIGNIKGGLFKFKEDLENLSNSSFAYYSYFDELTYHKDILGVTFMTLGTDGIIWLINRHGVLIAFDPENGNYVHHRSLNSMANARMLAVLVEDRDNLWLSSSNGIIHYNTQDKSLNIYHDTDGFQDNLFLKRSALKTAKGALFFGGVKGLSYFNPTSIYKKETKANLFINALEIVNKPAELVIPDQIKHGIEQLKSLVLEADQSSFSFRFSAIDNILTPRFKYAYRLKGFNDEWITVKKEPLATYTNIPSGSYDFEVKAGSKEGGWNIGPKVISIRVNPPFWRTKYAYLVYVFIFILMIYSLIKWIELRRNLISEKIISHKEKELHKVKMDFFAKISHEIQTPLTLIVSPIDDMLDRAQQNGNRLLEQRLKIISNNVKRLSRIVFELTTVRNKELGNERLFVSQNDLNRELLNVSTSFQEQARLKKIDFSVSCPQNLQEVWYDKDKVEHILYNLLSNAFKFTPKEGNIQLVVLPINNKNSIKISISDSGPGIPKSELESIFNLFYQSEIGKQHKGTGIGLALTKDLVTLHRGKIEVASSPMEGTVFTVVLPIAEDAYLKDEHVTTEEQIAPIQEVLISEEKVAKRSICKLEKTILIVEDNVELQLFLKELLSPLYQVLIADNGEEGYELAKRNLPQLILSDIMMPKLDGLEMTKLLKKDVVTKHIPIVLLTAKNTTNAKIIGLQSGAIEFIKKPFDTKELLLKINNIILSTEHIISKLKKEMISQPAINIDKSQDDVFLESLVAVINSKLENPNFKMEELADALHMSYSVLYRKCHGVTNKSLVDLVRFLRLKKAAIVIAKYGYSVADAAYVSGFNDPKYFSRCFKKNFKMTPNAFKKEAQEMGSEACLKRHKLDVV